MTCREINEILMEAMDAGGLPEQAQDHLQACGQCRTLVSAMESKHRGPAALDPALLDRVRTPIFASFARVRLLAPAGVFAVAFLAIFVVVAMAGAKYLGMYGPRAMTPGQRVAMFAVLVAGAVLAAVTTAQHMRPGARSLRGAVLFTIAITAIEAAFFALFHDYSTSRFVHFGAACLRAGLWCALPAGVLVWLLLRRGYAVAPVSTGAAVGVVAGLAGLTALQLHCPVLTVPHMALWHAGILIGSVAAGAGIGWAARSLRARRSR